MWYPYIVYLLSVFPKLGQETSGVSPPGNPCQCLQRRSGETESSPGGSRRHCGFGVNPTSLLVQLLFALHPSFCYLVFFFLHVKMEDPWRKGKMPSDVVTVS